MTPLGTAFSRVDALKRQLYDMLTNPRDAAAMLGGRIVESGQQAQALQEQTFGDPNRPFRVTDPQAMARLTDMLMAGPMGFAPAGTISGATRDVIRSSADSLASQLNELGFQATVQHSGSKAGPSSYVQIYDPETGRMFTNPVRFSGHGKGPREAAGVIDIQDPTKDIPNIVQEALQMRSQGPSKVFQKQAIVDDLIAGGMPPRQAYKEADKRVAGLLDQPAQSVVDTSYRGSHSAPNAETYGATLDSLEGIMPADVYSSRGKRLYGLGNPDVDAEWFAAAFKAKGKPDAEVTVYRAVPKGVKEINSGDWVTTSKTYADMHGENTVGDEYEILSKKVKAKTLSSEGYPYEFGYNE